MSDTPDLDYKPLSRWRCDVCRELIEKPEEGYVVWNWDQNGQNADFKVIHHMRCDDNSSPASLALPDLLGHDGAAKMLSWLSVGPVIIANNGGQGETRGVADIDEFVDLFRRLQTPFYEEARPAFKNYDVLADLADANEVFPYTQYALRKIVKKPRT
jgi:hypothetical protein